MDISTNRMIVADDINGWILASDTSYTSYTSLMPMTQTYVNISAYWFHLEDSLQDLLDDYGYEECQPTYPAANSGYWFNFVNYSFCKLHYDRHPESRNDRQEQIWRAFDLANR